MLMGGPLPAPSPLLQSGVPRTPFRSPSRLDFCMEEQDEVRDSPMDFSCTSFHSECPDIRIQEGAYAPGIAPSDPRPLIVEDDPPQAMDTREDTDIPDAYFAPSEQIDQIIIEPQAPIPVRPPSVQIHVDAHESVPPSRVATQRLNYPHHGFSRSALLQQKTFWNSRHEEWAEWQSRMQQESETDDAYMGLATFQQRTVTSPPPYMRTPPSGLERDLPGHRPRKREQEVHASIYPRVGDISALRDPYSANIDRSFFNLPLWTLHKTLYAFDMQQRSAFLSSPSTSNADRVQASMSSSTLSSYSSTTLGDDESNSTLVADDSPVAENQRPLEPLESVSSPRSLPSWNRFCGWEFSWYARWELLVAIFQRDHTKFDVFNTPAKAAPPESKADPSSPRRIFCFTVGEHEDDDSGDDEDEDEGEGEDEDYGMLVTDSSFSMDFDEECERALAFYNRGLKYSEVAM